MAILKALLLLVVSYILVKLSLALVFASRFVIDTILIGPANMGALNFFSSTHYGQVLLFLGTLLGSYLGALLSEKIFPGSKSKAFILFFALWLTMVFILPLFVKS